MTATLTTRFGQQPIGFPTFTLTTQQRRVLHAARNVALFAAAPFVGLAYIALTPFVGLGFLVWMAARALMEHQATVRKIALVAAAPFIGLAFIALLPFAGLATLATVAVRTPTRQ